MNSITSVNAQSSPDWIISDSNSVGTALGLCLNNAQDRIAAWGIAIDTTCAGYNVGLIIASGDGVLRVDTSFELGYCATETPVHLIANNSGAEFLYFTDNNVVTIQDSTFCYRVDTSGTIQSTGYIGEVIRSRAVSNGKYIFISADDPQGGKSVLRIDSTGNVTVMNTITDPYFVTSPQMLLATPTRVFEIFTRNLINDTAGVCHIYDTTGIYQSSFAIDIDAGKDEIIYSAHIAGSRIFFVCYDASSTTTFTAASDLIGNLIWKDTIPFAVNSTNSSCVDTLNNRAFIRVRYSSQVYNLYSIDLATGVIMDSTRIDSVGVNPNGLTINSGPAGGVFFTYMKVGTNTVFSEQYDASLNLIWSGAFSNPVCNVVTYPNDVKLDSAGNLYVLATSVPCGSSTILAKFKPSLVGTTPDLLSSAAIIYPNPTNSSFTIQLPEQNHLYYEVVISDIMGKTVYTFRSSESRMVIPTDGWSNGVYFIQVTTQDGESTVFKQIIQR
jgi:hypothetical protein